MQIEELKNIAREKGIVGAGGAGFPSYAKMTDKADTVIFPAQDLLCLGNWSRINTPGTVGDPNWKWRLDHFDALRQVLVDIKPWIIEANR